MQMRRVCEEPSVLNCRVIEEDDEEEDGMVANTATADNDEDTSDSQTV